MLMQDAFPSRYLKAADCDPDLTLVIKSVEKEEIGQEKEEKPVVKFRGQEKGLVLNMVNFKTIATNLGSEDSDDWLGKPVTLYATEVEFGGKTSLGIRIRLAKAGKTAQAKPKSAPSDNDGYADEEAAQQDSLKKSTGF